MTIVPLAVVCGVWTANLGGLGAATAVDAKIQPKLPDGATVPSEAIQTPANVTLPGVVAPGVPAGATDSVVDGASASGIPSAALAAYQRSAQIINSADTSCQIPWELIAAIGRVESDHGRYGGNVLSPKGISTPGIYGIPLDGSNGTTKVLDTDGGTLDNDAVYDRAVGPMQFIPSTWNSVKVDADGDGVRNPQDINDASLATAVYLCSGNDNLSTTPGQRASVYRYNHSQSYVDLVLRLTQAYSEGDYTAVPNGTTSGSLYSLSTPSAGGTAGAGKTPSAKATKGAGSGGASGRASSSPSAAGTPSSGSSSPSSGSGDGIFKNQPSPSPTKKSPADAAKDTGDAAGDTVTDAAIGLTKALELCGQAGLTGTKQTACANAIKNDTLAEAKDNLGDVVSGLGGVVGGLLGN